MKKLFITSVFLLCIVLMANGQDYKNAIGLRLGWSYGLTFKHFISEKSALEGIADYRWGGLGITGLYEIHNNLADVEGLNWYFGGGAHVGFYGTSYGGGSGTFVGIDGILGLEYNFKDLPINISADWKPAFTFGYSHFGADNGALSVRYTF
jgi:hypothetical protein